MGSAEEAEKAKSALDGTQMDGRALKVDVAKEMVPVRLALAAATVAAAAATVVAAATAGNSDRQLTLGKRRPKGRRSHVNWHPLHSDGKRR